MTALKFQNQISSLLKKVLAGAANYTELQAFVDNAVIEDKLPNEIPKKLLRCIYELQTDLELIAENQSTHAGTRSMLTNTDIIEKLSKYETKLNVNSAHSVE